MRTAKVLALVAALATAGAPVPVHAGGCHGGLGSGFWAGIGVISGLIGVGIIADALSEPDVVYVNPPPAYYPPPAGSPPAAYDAPAEDRLSADDAEEREREAYFAGWAAGRDAAADDEPYYPRPVGAPAPRH